MQSNGSQQVYPICLIAYSVKRSVVIIIRSLKLCVLHLTYKWTIILLVQCFLIYSTVSFVVLQLNSTRLKCIFCYDTSFYISVTLPVSHSSLFCFLLIYPFARFVLLMKCCSCVLTAPLCGGVFQFYEWVNENAAALSIRGEYVNIYRQLIKYLR